MKSSHHLPVLTFVLRFAKLFDYLVQDELLLLEEEFPCFKLDFLVVQELVERQHYQ